MYQMDLFYTDKESFLYGEIEKMRHSYDKRTRAIFALISELQDEVMGLREMSQKKKKKK